MFIKGQHGSPGCDFCGEEDAPTSDLSDVAEYINERLLTFYGKAVDQLDRSKYLATVTDSLIR
jgi:hypothetical protein